MLNCKNVFYIGQIYGPTNTQQCKIESCVINHSSDRRKVVNSTADTWTPQDVDTSLFKKFLLRLSVDPMNWRLFQVQHLCGCCQCQRTLLIYLYELNRSGASRSGLLCCCNDGLHLFLRLTLYLWLRKQHLPVQSQLQGGPEKQSCVCGCLWQKEIKHN